MLRTLTFSGQQLLPAILPRRVLSSFDLIAAASRGIWFDLGRRGRVLEEGGRRTFSLASNERLLFSSLVLLAFGGYL